MTDLLLPSTTGVGSLPGTDVREAVRVVMGEWPDLPYLPELPARGPGADIVGRTASLLVGLAFDLQPSGWRLVPRPGRDLRRAVAMFGEDLDALQELGEGWDGPLKLQVCGPWSLAASMELPRGGPVLGDRAAVTDLHASLSEGVAGHVAEVSRRLPRARVLLQVDEPLLPAVLAGSIKTPSGFGRLPAVEEQQALPALGALLALTPHSLVHCCATDVPIDLVRRAGAEGVSLDVTLLGSGSDDALGELWESRARLYLGLVTGVDGPLPSPAATAEQVSGRARRIGIPAEQAVASVVLTPSCGLAGASPGYVRAVAAHLREAARILTQDPEGAGG